MEQELLNDDLVEQPVGFDENDVSDSTSPNDHVLQHPDCVAPAPASEQEKVDLYELMFAKFQSIREERANFRNREHERSLRGAVPRRLLSHPIDGLHFSSASELKSALDAISNKTSKLSRIQRDFLSALPSAVFSDLMAAQSKSAESV